ncbi:MAG: hypothetical protein JNL21_23395, partial [Myxococcales bacterium]|nr:hypothetical protein [Myxococcales bacterium]
DAGRYVDGSTDVEQLARRFADDFVILLLVSRFRRFETTERGEGDDYGSGAESLKEVPHERLRRKAISTKAPVAKPI